MKKLKISLVITLLLGMTISTINNVNAEEERKEYLKESDYFSEEQLNSWENEIFNRVNSTQAKGDFKVSRSKRSKRYAYGNWTWRDGVICISDSRTLGFEHGHAGIIATAPHYYSTVEATPGKGVTIVNRSWINDFNKVWQVGVTSTTVEQDAKAAKWAESKVGLGYNYIFPYKSVNGKSFYCSELVWAAYLATTGVDLDSDEYGKIIHPYEILGSPKVTKIFEK